MQGDLEGLKEHVRLGGVLNAGVPLIAASHGHIHILEWLLSIEYPLDEILYVIACDSGKKEVIMWLYEKNVEWNKQTCENICMCGPSDYFDQWRLEADCPPTVILYLSDPKNCVECFECILDLNCPFDIKSFLIRDPDMIEGVKEFLLQRYQLQQSIKAWEFDDESLEYGRYIQWPPQEVMEDVYKLIS